MDAGDATPVPTGKPATLEDVAAAAGVSRALVSIVIREAPGASAATRERVLRAADELGYRPDVRARLLARSQSKLIGTVFGMAGTFHFDVLDGLYNAAEDRGYELILSALTQSRGEARAVQPGRSRGPRPASPSAADPGSRWSSGCGAVWKPTSYPSRSPKHPAVHDVPRVGMLRGRRPPPRR